MVVVANLTQLALIVKLVEMLGDKNDQARSRKAICEHAEEQSVCGAHAVASVKIAVNLVGVRRFLCSVFFLCFSGVLMKRINWSLYRVGITTTKIAGANKENLVLTIFVCVRVTFNAILYSSRTYPLPSGSAQQI